MTFLAASSVPWTASASLEPKWLRFVLLSEPPPLWMAVVRLVIRIPYWQLHPKQVGPSRALVTRPCAQPARCRLRCLLFFCLMCLASFLHPPPTIPRPIHKESIMSMGKQVRSQGARVRSQGARVRSCMLARLSTSASIDGASASTSSSVLVSLAICKISAGVAFSICSTCCDVELLLLNLLRCRVTPAPFKLGAAESLWVMFLPT